MNSYSYELKKEVASIESTGDEAISELSAIIHTSGEIIKNSDGIKVIVSTEIPELAEKIKNI